MILVIPEISIKNGKCLYCIEGEKVTEKIYQDFARYPDKLCSLFRRENARTLHITDLDSFEAGIDNKVDILGFNESVDIPLIYWRKFDSKDECEFYLENDIYRIVVCENSAISFNDIKEIVAKYTPQRVIYYMKYLDPGSPEKKLIKDLYNSDINRIMLYNETRKFSDAQFYQNSDFASDRFRITLFGGVDSYSSLAAVNKLSYFGVDSVIIGKPLYKNKFPCQKIWRLIEARTEK